MNKKRSQYYYPLIEKKIQNQSYIHILIEAVSPFGPVFEFTGFCYKMSSLKKIFYTN